MQSQDASAKKCYRRRPYRNDGTGVTVGILLGSAANARLGLRVVLFKAILSGTILS
jgi:hypothetical protein